MKRGDDQYTAAGSIATGLFAGIAIVALGAVAILPLPWKAQAIFGGVLIAGSLLLNWISGARVATLALMTVSLFSTLRYAYWRVVQTYYGITSSGHLHQWDTVFVLLLLVAEFYAFATLVLGYFQTLRPLRRPPIRLTGDPQSWPTVDVYIPTYNESLSVVRATVLGALSLDYPSDKLRVYVLDDGRRKEFGEFAERAGAGYITRSNNAHAKAGNINHAFAQTSGEYVAIFDSDHIPTRSFLKLTLGWFMRDRRLGMVQTPHHFYSPDPFERNLGQFRRIPNEGELFHRLVQDGNDLWNASFFCGSCAVMRRTTLNEIGGIAVETVTEDAHTALRMQKRGWNTAYINVPLAAGLATESLAAHIGQRIRWARGMIQILRTENPLFARRLSLSQRLCYFNATTHFLFATPRLVFLVMPLVYLFFGMVNIYGYSFAVFAYALPHIVLSNMTNSRVQGTHRFSFWNEIYEVVLAPYILFPTLLALINPRLGKFNVTSKGGVIRSSYFDRRVAWPLLLLLGLNVAGVAMAGQRWVADPLHRDTVLMNGIWTLYNLVILSVATSVAWERKQRRSQVRVNVNAPMTLSVQGYQPIAGVATQMSAQGALARLAHSVQLPRGTPVTAVIEANPSRIEIAARVAQSSKRHVHLLFSEVSLTQERYLVNLIYSRPEAWVSWHKSRGKDRPLLSFAHICWLAVRGIAVILAGLLTRRPPSTDEAGELRQRKQRTPVAACVIAAATLAVSPLPVRAENSTANQKGSIQTQGTTMPARPAAAFHDQYELGSLAEHRAIVLTGAGSSRNFFLDMPVTKIISAASLDLRYRAPLVRSGESRLEVWLNGTRAGSVPLNSGPQEARVELPADLLTTNNTLTLQLEGNCAACSHSRAPWITIALGSTLTLSGTRLPLANDLALLPIPFFDPASQHAWSLPIVFSDRPSGDALKAASLVASWFGIFSDFRGVRFPTTVGVLPEGNAVVFATRDSELSKELSLPSQQGSLIAIRDNPRDPYGKLLILAGESPEDLLTAAQLLVTRNNAEKHIDAVPVGRTRVPERGEYQAPRWLDASNPSLIGTYTTNERLRMTGSGSTNIYFRLPPDLFLQAQDSVPLLLKFSYSGVAEGSYAALHVRLNDRDVDSIRLRPAPSNVDEQVIVRLPTGRFQPYTNTLTIDADFGRAGAAPNSQYAAIHRDSSIDLSGLPHSVVLPRLELFADSGYPFTAWPDLRRTAVVLSQAPSSEEYETLFDLMGFVGAQTGAPTINVSITNAEHIEDVRDKDLVLLGSRASQPLLANWASNMPLDVASGLKLNPEPQASRLLHPEWPFRSRDRSKLAKLLATLLETGASPDLVVEDFASPLQAERSVVAIVPQGENSTDAIAAMFTPALDKGPIYGGVSIARNGRFQSFLIGDLAYHSGQLDPVQQGTIFLIEHYLFIPAPLLVFALMVGLWLYRSTERVAARRLAAARNMRLTT